MGEVVLNTIEAIIIIVKIQEMTILIGFLPHTMMVVKHLISINAEVGTEAEVMVVVEESIGDVEILEVAVIKEEEVEEKTFEEEDQIMISEDEVNQINSIKIVEDTNIKTITSTNNTKTQPSTTQITNSPTHNTPINLTLLQSHQLKPMVLLSISLVQVVTITTRKLH